MSLFQEGEFTGYSGGQLKWKIECDALEVDDWKCLATMILDYEKRPFRQLAYQEGCDVRVIPESLFLTKPQRPLPHL